MRFIFSEDLTGMMPPGAERIYRRAEDFTESFTPMSPDERSDLRASAMETQPIFPE